MKTKQRGNSASVGRTRVSYGPVRYDSANGEPAVNHASVARSSVLASTLLLRHMTQCKRFATGRLLDVGCGYAPYQQLFADRVTSQIATDVPNTLRLNPRIHVFATAESLPFATASFDTVLCTEVLEHVRDPLAALDECTRLLRPGGVLILSMPWMYPIHDGPWDYQRFTVHALQALIEERGYSIEYLGLRGGPVAVVTDVIAKVALRFAYAAARRAPPLLSPLLLRTMKALVLGLQTLYLWASRVGGNRAYPARTRAAGEPMTLGYVVVARRLSRVTGPLGGALPR